MRRHTAKLLIVGGSILASLMSAGVASAQANGANVGKPREGGISVSASPTLVIGGNEADETTTFGAIAGATRLPDGRILVGDRGEYNLRVFSAVAGRVMLPSTLEVFEIGRDYILGQFMDVEIAIPQVHLYQLTR